MINARVNTFVLDSGTICLSISREDEGCQSNITILHITSEEVKGWAKKIENAEKKAEVQARVKAAMEAEGVE